MKWIITGGCGFIGSNIAKRLKQSGGEPIVIDNISRPRVIENRKWLKQKFSIDCIQMDILDKKDPIFPFLPRINILLSL